MSNHPNTPRPFGLHTNTTFRSMSSDGLKPGNFSDASGADNSAQRQLKNRISPRREISRPSSVLPASHANPRHQIKSAFANDVQGQPVKRAHSALSRQSIQKAHDSIDWPNDSETEQGTRKRARKGVGCHVDEPRLPISASLSNANQLIFHTLKELAPPDVLQRWAILVPSGSQVSSDKTAIDKGLLPLSLGNLDGAYDGEVLARLKEYLEAMRDGREMKLEELPNRALEIHVGFHKEDPKVPVYAYQLLKSNGITYPTFNVRKSNAKKSTVSFKNHVVSYKDVKYIEKYVRGNLEESRKEVQYDLAKISESEVPTVAGRPQPTRQTSKIVQEQQDHDEGATELNDGLEEQRLRVGSRNVSSIQRFKSTIVQQAEKVANSFDDFVKDVLSLEKLASDSQAKIEKLQEANRDQAQEIADLRATISRAQAQIVTHPMAPLALAVHNFEIEPGRFGTIPREMENGGMLREKQARVTMIRGNEYEERVFLLPCKIQVPGQQSGRTFEHNGMSFTQIMDGDVEQLVQITEPDCWFNLKADCSSNGPLLRSLRKKAITASKSGT